MTGLHDKIILITGASDGIGRIAALELAKMGATILGVGRNPDKSARVAEELRAINPASDMLVYDLSLMTQVRALAAEIDARLPRIDVLLNNAGAIFYTKWVTAEGLENTFALNHLAPFLLTNLLLDKLIASQARVVTVSSAWHHNGVMNFDDLMYERRAYSPWGAYGQSKLANILFANELARRVAGTGVTSNSLHPGFVYTSFGSNQPSMLAKAVSLASRVVGISAEKGAATSVLLASSPEVANVTGAYYSEGKRANPAKSALDQSTAKRLWELSERIVDL